MNTESTPESRKLRREAFREREQIMRRALNNALVMLGTHVASYPPLQEVGELVANALNEESSVKIPRLQRSEDEGE